MKSMKPHFHNASRVMLATLIVLVIHTTAMAETQPIRVLVYGEHKGDNIVYHYTVINNGTDEFNNVTIGSRFHPKVNGPVPQLGKLPIGWKYGRTGEVGTEIILDPHSTTQPQGWASKVYGQGLYSLEWLVPWGNSGGIEPGQTLSGFSVTVPRGDTIEMKIVPEPAVAAKMYVAGGFYVGYWFQEKSQKIFGPLEKQ